MTTCVNTSAITQVGPPVNTSVNALVNALMSTLVNAKKSSS